MKQDVIDEVVDVWLSHPAGVRGLKPSGANRITHPIIVAPRRGAWIETLMYCRNSQPSHSSHPAGVRGLKPCFG